MDRREGFEPRTRAGYQAILDNHLDVLGGLPLPGLSSQTVRAWYAGLGDAKSLCRRISA
ncbi:hypothetical protein [Mycobacterium sp. 1245852.3]|uniref:hypothetical protein n=1 Tax=Mycobacterium sp. 1245852.3 TaxID=1856860 RepID=UPI001E2F157F|nr:hypothetical protein [Mycobacterium sp. 1245852.3]